MTRDNLGDRVDESVHLVSVLRAKYVWTLCPELAASYFLQNDAARTLGERNRHRRAQSCSCRTAVDGDSVGEPGFSSRSPVLVVVSQGMWLWPNTRDVGVGVLT